MRRGIGLRGYAQQDPLNEFRKEAFRLYEELSGFIRHQVASTIFRVSIQQQPQPPVGRRSRCRVPASGRAGALPVGAGARARAHRRRRRSAEPRDGRASAAIAGPASSGTAGSAGVGRGRARGSRRGPGYTPAGAKIGRNDACWCGSGLQVQEVPRPLSGPPVIARRVVTRQPGSGAGPAPRRALVGVLLVVGLRPSTGSPRRATATRQRPADAIVVLGAAQFNGTAERRLRGAARSTPSTSTRPALAPYLVVTGGKLPGGSHHRGGHGARLGDRPRRADGRDPRREPGPEHAGVAGGGRRRSSGPERPPQRRLRQRRDAHAPRPAHGLRPGHHGVGLADPHQPDATSSRSGARRRCSTSWPGSPRTTSAAAGSSTTRRPRARPEIPCRGRTTPGCRHGRRGAVRAFFPLGVGETRHLYSGKSPTRCPAPPWSNRAGGRVARRESNPCRRRK